MYHLEIYQQYVKNNPELKSKKRRALLINQMRQNDINNVDCSQCIGNCCTYVSNSMQITPLEAIELIQYLTKQNMTMNKIKLTMNKTIIEFRLDKSNLSYGNKNFRKTYTCPFYQNCNDGCSISPEYKPYGCLAFNPIKKSVTMGKDCRSDIQLLEKRALNHQKAEDNFNIKIRKHLQLNWDKQAIPIAILEILKAEENLLPSVSFQ